MRFDRVWLLAGRVCVASTVAVAVIADGEQVSVADPGVTAVEVIRSSDLVVITTSPVGSSDRPGAQEPYPTSISPTSSAPRCRCCTSTGGTASLAPKVTRGCPAPRVRVVEVASPNLSGSDMVK